MTVPRHKNEDGKIGVLVSHGWGAGWSTWADEEQKETLLFHADIIKAFLTDGADAAIAKANEILPDGFYDGGKGGLAVEWVDEGSQFEVEEYDGAESLHIIGKRNYFTA